MRIDEGGSRETTTCLLALQILIRVLDLFLFFIFFDKYILSVVTKYYYIIFFELR